MKCQKCEVNEDELTTIENIHCIKHLICGVHKNRAKTFGNNNSMVGGANVR